MTNLQKRIWKVIPFEDKDLPSIGLFFKKHFRSASQYGSMGLFQWRTVENYLMRGIINLIKDGDQIVSTLSNTPKRLLIKGDGFLVSEIGDANTDPRYQRQGMLTLLINQSTRDALEKGVCCVYSTPDTQTPSLPAFIKKAQYLPMKDLEIESLFFPLDISFFFQAKSRWLIGSYASSFFLTLAYFLYLVKKCLNPLPRNVVIDELIQDLPDDWNIFWEKARQPYDCIFERSRQALQWRFFKNPNKYKFYIIKQEETIIGYMVYRIVSDVDIKRIVIADYLFLPGYEACFKKILLKVFEDAFRVGANLISLWCIKGSNYSEFIKKFFFMKRKNILLIWFQNKFVSAFKTGYKWHFTISDSDNV